ncbi:MAG: ArnT family glycosyltransferase [Ktedonobacterales bacterium]
MRRFQKYFAPTGIFFLALLVRLIYNLTCAAHYIAIDDANLYNRIAYNIVYQHCFCIDSNHPEISRAPLWPLILSLFYRVTPRPSLQLLRFDVQVVYGRFFLCFVGSLTCVLVYLLARDLFGRRIALITGSFAAIYSGLFIYDGWLYSESLYTFLLTAFVYSLYRLQRTAEWRWVICCGLLLGLVNLTRPNGPLLFGMLLLWAIAVALARDLPWQTVVKSTLAIAGIAALLMAPWTYRNYEVTQAFVPVAIGTGDVLLGAYNDSVLRGTTGLWVGPSSITPRPDVPEVVLLGKDKPQYTVDDDQIATDYAVHWIALHWSAMPRLIGYHLLNMWLPFTSIEHAFPFREFPSLRSSQVVWYMTLLMPIPVFLLALLGLLATWRYRKKQLIIVYIVIVLTIVENLAFWGDMRFRAPIEPLLVLLAGGALWAAVQMPSLWSQLWLRGSRWLFSLPIRHYNPDDGQCAEPHSSVKTPDGNA